MTQPVPDPDLPKPGILLEGTHRPSKNSRLKSRVFGGVLTAVGIALFVGEAMNGWQWEVSFLGFIHIPAAVIYAVVALFGLLMALNPGSNDAPWYQMWSLVEYRDEPGGLRLFVGRLPADQPGLPVRRGESIEVHAALTYKARGGLERHYAFRIVTPSGEVEFRTPIWIERLTMAPLEERAAVWGIPVTAHGEAQAIQRLGATTTT